MTKICPLDVPGIANPLPDVECGQQFCRLGCVCDSLEKAGDPSTFEHCSLPECMLQCVCGYQKGNPTHRRLFSSLLKGNDKINRSASGRRQRARKIPGRFSEYLLEHVPASKAPRRTRPANESTPNAFTKVTLSKKKVTKKTVIIRAPVNTSSKMRKLLQAERFNFQKLITEEKRRTFDDDVDLNIPEGQTLQFVAWIRFHTIYQSGRIHIRFLCRRTGPVILVMRPNEIVAADMGCDIQSMKGDRNAPNIVQILLEPFISPEQSSQFAFLLCDGSKWELVGWITPLVPKTPTLQPEQPAEPTDEDEATEVRRYNINLVQTRKEVEKRLRQIKKKVDNLQAKRGIILPGDLPIKESNFNRQNVHDLVVKDPNMSLYPTAESLATLSQLIQNNSEDFGIFSNFGTLVSSRSKTTGFLGEIELPRKLGFSNSR